MALNKEDLKEYTLKDFRHHLSQIVGEVNHGQKRVRVTSYGKTAGYFISEDELAYLDAIEEAYDRQEIEKILFSGLETAQKPEKVDKDWSNNQIDSGLAQVQNGNLVTGEDAYARLKAKMEHRKAQPS